MNLSEEQILLLAPDEASKKSGKELANAAKWVRKGVNDRALWGECQGSGSKPYQTQINTSDLAFKCSCPSRKFPCKHGLGLLLLFAKDKKGFTTGDAPTWVTEWLNRRVGKQEKQSGNNDKPVDEAAQAKRQQARQSKVSDGVAELTAWLKDIVRNGIISIPEKGPAFFENISRRLIDAQAPGLAGMVRMLGETNFYAEDWQTRFMDQLLRIYMLTEGFNNLASLDELLQQDVRTWIGFTQNQDELKQLEGVLDTWLIIGKQVTEVDAVTTEKFWLYGTKTNIYALVLQFIVRGQGVQFSFTPGLFVQAELVFFPSVSPQRALFKRQLITPEVIVSNKLEGWLKVAELETELNGVIPFRTERPFIVSNLRLVQHNQQWWLQDRDNSLMPLRPDYKHIWKLLAVSGGRPMDMAVIGKENQFEPLGVWEGNSYTII